MLSSNNLRIAGWTWDYCSYSMDFISEFWAVTFPKFAQTKWRPRLALVLRRIVHSVHIINCSDETLSLVLHG